MVTLLKSGLVLSALIITAGGSAAAPAAASTDVVCYHNGDCWRSRDRLDYPAGVGITFHSDAWGVAHRAGQWRWRSDRSGRSYERDGAWIAF